MSKRSIARNMAKRRMKIAGIVDTNKMMHQKGSNGEQLWKAFVKKNTHVNGENVPREKGGKDSAVQD